MPTTPEQRARIIKEQGITCYLCGKKTSRTERQIDHIQAQAAGGSDDDDNLRVSCKRCNRAKGKTDLPQYLEREQARLERHLETIKNLRKEIASE